jgi:hypothetical protein
VGAAQSTLTKTLSLIIFSAKKNAPTNLAREMWTH